MDHPQSALDAGMVRRMWPGGGHGGTAGGVRTEGDERASANPVIGKTAFVNSANAPRLRGQPGMALVGKCGWIAADLSGVSPAVAGMSQLSPKKHQAAQKPARKFTKGE
jgi:hypothetical protein